LTLAIFAALYANGDSSKMGKALLVFLLKVTQEVLNISYYPFRFWFLSIFSFVIHIF